MPDHIPFLVRLELSSAIIPGQRLTLDGLLAATIFDRTRSLEIAHNEIPLGRLDGVWMASAALIETPVPTGKMPTSDAVLIQSLRAKLDISPDMIAPGKRGYPRIEVARGPYRNRMTTYTAYDSSAIRFTGFGDIDAVRDLLEDIPAVGAKRHCGFGKVSKIEIVETDNDHSGITFSDGTPARPIPAEVWHARNGIDVEMALETYSPPYWNGQRVLCALPKHQIVSSQKARQLAGM